MLFEQIKHYLVLKVERHVGIVIMRLLFIRKTVQPAVRFS